jgi:hypothetical protein
VEEHSTDEISPESPLEAPRSVWTPLGTRERRGQAKGRVLGRSRNAGLQVLSGHNNRAGHRLYVKVNQGRAFRRSVLGWGSWRKPLDRNRDRHVAAQAQLNPHGHDEPREVRRAEKLLAYRDDRKARLRVGWRKP